MQTRLGRPLEGRKVHFIGAGGVGMAALAELLLAMGYDVSGSDIAESNTVRRLRDLGVNIAIGAHTPGEVEGADHVIVSNAVPAASPPIVRARELGVEVLPRADLLGLVLAGGRSIAVSGTHGKTTTSSMVAKTLDAAGFQPSFLIGGDINDVGSGARLGASDIVVAEADEAFGTFLHLRPHLAVVTNVDADHLEYYGTQRAIDDAFRAFLDARADDGVAVVCRDDAGVRRILPDVRAPVVTYGFADADLVASRADDGWRLTWRAQVAGTVRLRIPGRHMMLNAAGAAATAIILGADPSTVVDALSSFGGVDRRFTVRGMRRGVTVVDDYAHNPAKVAATLAAAREAYPDARIVALFQPHLYTRTRDLASAFGRSFGDADVLVVTDVYGQREQPIPGVTGRVVVDAVQSAEARPSVVRYVPALADAIQSVAELLRPGDVAMTIGAGDVTTAGPRLLKLLGDAES